MRDWIIESGFASESNRGLGAADKEAVEAARDLAWEAYQTPIRNERDRAVSILERVIRPRWRDRRDADDATRSQGRDPVGRLIRTAHLVGPIRRSGQS